MRYLLLICLSFSLLQCSVEDAELEGTTWRVVKFTNEEGKTRRSKINCSASFNDGILFMNLDINRCEWHYSFVNDNEIVYDGIRGCTAVCCDEDNSDEASRMVVSCTRFSIDGNKLLLTREDGIEVKLVAD